MKVGVLALQGGFALHQARLEELACPSLQVAKVEDLSAVNALILPGGESSTLLKLCSADFRKAIVDRVQKGMPLLATCAGLILISHHVSHPEQESLDLLDVDVQRNAYGRQKDSFITSDIVWTEKGRLAVAKTPQLDEPLEGVFIRAPKIERVGAGVEIFAELRRGDAPAEPILVRQGNIFGATFHPELSPGARAIHQLFLSALS